MVAVEGEAVARTSVADSSLEEGKGVEDALVARRAVVQGLVV